MQKANMMQLARLKISALQGERVCLKSIRDRNRVTMVTGVLDGVYPALFTVTQDGEKKKCFSYTDIIMNRLFIKKV